MKKSLPLRFASSTPFEKGRDTSCFSSPDKAKWWGLLAFTLVELIVVVTILAILATIWFVSYSSYLIWVRDTNRIAQMTKMSDGLNLYSTRNALPIPEDYVEVQINGSLIWYQWYAGSSVLETIEYEKGGVDPKDNTYFTYYLTKDRKYFQLLWFLEEWSDLTGYTPSSMRRKPERQGELSLLNRAYANTYSERIPTVLWKKLWVLTDDLNTPIQEIWSVTTAGLLDIWSTSDSYKAYLKDDDVIEGDSTDLVSINPSGSCLRIKQMKGSSKSGVYKINPEWNNAFEVYCDMETDGGGWTYLVTIDGSEGLLYGNDLWWDPNYAWPERITDIDDTWEQWVYQSFYSVWVSELSFYAKDGGYSIFRLNSWYRWKDIQSLISQVSGENWASQTSGGSTGHAKVHVWDRISVFEWSNKYNCPITYGASEKLSMLASHSVYLPHTSIFSTAPTTNVPRSSLFWWGTAVWLWYTKAETASGQASPICFTDWDMWQDESYVVLMWR